MSFSEDVVNTAMERYRSFKANARMEGAPEILLRTDDHDVLTGVGFQWKSEGKEPVRNAFSFGSSDDAKEFRRRLTENP